MQWTLDRYKSFWAAPTRRQSRVGVLVADSRQDSFHQATASAATTVSQSKSRMVKRNRIGVLR